MYPRFNPLRTYLSVNVDPSAAETLGRAPTPFPPIRPRNPARARKPRCPLTCNAKPGTPHLTASGRDGGTRDTPRGRRYVQAPPAKGSHLLRFSLVQLLVQTLFDPTYFGKVFTMCGGSASGLLKVAPRSPAWQQ